MALLTLKDIGKIYVSDSNVSVGIRGVNLSFDRGEFVAITGKSGSGKSTLLNVISGMDSYEEGELFIEGQATSHYMQPEWEAYRERYISFIFQDYNILESFTVLQNVELALMHIEDKRLRRTKALELIERVGLSGQIRQKGSRLSGGQKQRTVIARALAKDSPIILADEPTGNLDSRTSKEIIALLKEVSADKLLIVVTHNLEQVEAYATRQIRIFDGAVESDHIIRAATPTEKRSTSEAPTQPVRRERCRQIRNGFVLGKTIFAAKPKLSFFLCLLLLLGTMGVFLVTALCGEAGELFKPRFMFAHIEGRLVLAKQSGEVFTERELESLVSEHGAQGYLHFDQLLDQGVYQQIVFSGEGDAFDEAYSYPMANSVYGKDYGEDITGCYPTEVNEVFLYLPISYQPIVGKDSLLVTEILMGGVGYDLVGVKYYYDNNLTPECLFTDEGFRTATALYYLAGYSDARLNIAVIGEDGATLEHFNTHKLVPSFDMPADRIYIDCADYRTFINKAEGNYSTVVSYHATYYRYNYYYGGEATSYLFERVFTDESLTDVKPLLNEHEAFYNSGVDCIIISDELLCEMAESVLEGAYGQASLFFENDQAAHQAVDALQEAGYIAVPSDTTYEPDAETTILTMLSSVAMAIVWGVAILFLAFFINLCSSRTLDAFKGEMAIMRSMGIPVRVIRIGMYVRMLLSLIPGFVLVSLTAILIFTSPRFNSYFVYLYAWQYLLIFAGMLLLTVRTTHKQVRRLFGESVKTSLKGGSAE